MKTILQLSWQKCVMLLAAGCGLVICLSAQSLKNVVPPSPNVAALGKYGDVPVSLYTGIPNISIPLYDIDNGGLRLPISLNYHAGGVKVEEVASSVGLGWSLSAGGVISRTINGIADDNGKWFPMQPADRVETIMGSGNAAAINLFLLDVNNGIRDSAPDTYYFNFGNYSGKFFHDQAGNAYTVPRQKMLITPYSTGWKIVTADGTVYVFDKVESLNSATSCVMNQDTDNVTGWYLTSIKSADGKQEITFTYEPANYFYQTLIGETKYFQLNGTVNYCLRNPGPCMADQYYRSHRVSNINFQEGYIKFTYNNIRCDLTDDKSLDVVEVFTKDNLLLKRYKMSYSYFGSTAPCDRLYEQYKRLKLNSIVEESLSEVKPAYEFTYEESIDMPARTSYAQDHWGFYNGKHTNSTMIAAFSTINLQGQTMYFAGANRKTDATKAQVGILKEIKYPTGGQSLFTFESNQVSGSIAEPEVEEKQLWLGATNYLVDNLPDPYYSAVNLVVPASGAMVEYTVSGIESPLWQGCDIVRCIVIKDNNEAVPFRELTTYSSGGIELWPAGEYKMKLITDCGVDAIANFSALVVAQVPIATTLETNVVGGLRIKQIEDRPGNGALPVIRTYRYTQEADATKSSGVLTNQPVYGYDLTAHRVFIGPEGEQNGSPVDCIYRVRTSASNYPLATTRGGYVGYNYVVEDQGTNGETRFEFTAYANGPTPVFPFPPMETFDWRRGFQTSSRAYLKNGSTLSIVKRNTQTPYGGPESRIYALKVGKNHVVVGHPPSDLQVIPIYTMYPIITEFFDLGVQTERTYVPGDDTKYNEKTTEYTYNDQHLQMIQSKTTTSVSDANLREQVVVNKKYPFDFTFSGTAVGAEALGIKKLQDLHVANAVVEEYKVKQNINNTNVVTNPRVIEGTVTQYRTDNPYPDQLYGLDISQPIAGSTFGTGSYLNANAFVKNTAYKTAVQFVSYDAGGNLAVQRKDKDVPYSYLWGYDKRYLIAEVSNCASTTAFAYSSFESDEKGGWTYNIASTATDIPKTGNYYYKLNGASNNITRVLAVGKYKLEYWAKSATVSISTGGTLTLIRSSAADSNGWILYEYEVNVTSTPTLTFTGSTTSCVDELRLYPVECQMTTYTHDLLRGISSETDENCSTTYFKYDDFGRLRLEKDTDQNITRKLEYYYQKR